jgi:uncharacterized coiled-coil protein SlyX
LKAKMNKSRRQHAEPNSLKEVLADHFMGVTPKGSDLTDDTSSSTQSGFFFERIWKKFHRDKDSEKMKSEIAAKEQSLSRQQEVIDQLTFALDMEKTIRDMERKRMQELIDRLQGNEAPNVEGSGVAAVSDLAGKLYANLSRSFGGGGGGAAGSSMYRGGDGLSKTWS